MLIHEQIYLVVHGVFLSVYILRALLSSRSVEPNNLAVEHLRWFTEVSILTLFACIRILCLFIFSWAFLTFALLAILLLGAMI
jgi:hypothetical protein